MMLARLAMRLALQGVPPHLRDAVHGDLIESQGGAHDALMVALHFQAEPYRGAADRRSVLLLLLAAAGLLWVLPLAAHGLLSQAAVVGGAFDRAAQQLWGAPALVAAAACGLLVGRASLLSPHADAARLHLAALLAPWAAWAAASGWQAAGAAALLVLSAWFAGLNAQATAESDDRVTGA